MAETNIQDPSLNEYISLAEGAEYSSYSQDYLRFRIRQGKLKAKKFARNWLTTKLWLDEYLKRVENYKNRIGEEKSVKSLKKNKVNVIIVGNENGLDAAKSFSVAESKLIEEGAFKEDDKEEVVKLKISFNPDPTRLAYSHNTHLPIKQRGLKLAAFVCGLALLLALAGFLLGSNYSFIEPILSTTKKTIEVGAQRISAVFSGLSANASFFIKGVGQRILPQGEKSATSVLSGNKASASVNVLDTEILSLSLFLAGNSAEWLQKNNNQTATELLLRAATLGVPVKK